VNTGNSGGAGGVATTPVKLGVVFPAVVVVAAGFVVPVGGAEVYYNKNVIIFMNYKLE
jgi:hypothetical protein